MTKRWLFGYYYSYNKNYDPNLTPDLTKAKWRSQYPVESGIGLTDNENNWLLFGNVHLVFLPDLAYQLKNTDPIDDSYWLKSVSEPRRVDSIYLAGGSSVRQTFTQEVEYFVNSTDSTNPNALAFARPLAAPKALQEVGYLSFAEERLELGYDYGAVGGMNFSNEIIKMADDSIEQRNAVLHLPRGRWQLGDRTIAESAADNLAQVTYLRQFHLERVGSFQGFRFRDWSDFRGEDEDIATGDGIKSQFQLVKVYKVLGSWSYRPIQKPVPGSVEIYLNQIPDTENWTIDYSSGVISRLASVPLGARITADFEFDIPVWFESDQISFNLQGYKPETQEAIYRLDSVFVVEQRLPLKLPWIIRPMGQITEALDLGIIYDTSYGYSFSTDKIELKNGYAVRLSKYQNSSNTSRLEFNLGSKIYDREEIKQILAFFWNARGTLKSFDFIDRGRIYRVRFNQNELNFKFEAAEGQESFFSLPGLKLIVDY